MGQRSARRSDRGRVFPDLQELQQVTGPVRKLVEWNGGVRDSRGALQIPQNEIAQIIMGKSIGSDNDDALRGRRLLRRRTDRKESRPDLTLTEGSTPLVVSMPGYRTVEREVYTTPMMYSQIEVVLEYGNFWETKHRCRRPGAATARWSVMEGSTR